MATQQTPPEKLKTALDLFGLAEAIMRQNLLRKHPESSDAEIDLLLRSWLTKCEETEHADATPFQPR
jgi:hypothetical protein